MSASILQQLQRTRIHPCDRLLRASEARRVHTIHSNLVRAMPVACEASEPASIAVQAGQNATGSAIADQPRCCHAHIISNMALMAQKPPFNLKHTHKKCGAVKNWERVYLIKIRKRDPDSCHLFFLPKVAYELPEACSTSLGPSKS